MPRRLSGAAPEHRRSCRPRGVVLVTADAVHKLKERNMAKLTDTPLIVLSKAAARDDGMATIPDGLNKAAAAKVAASLVSRKLMRQVQSRSGLPVWREDEEGRGTSLVITREGRKAIGIEERENDSSKPATAAKNEGARVQDRHFKRAYRCE
jgi:hypothetical protein